MPAEDGDRRDDEADRSTLDRPTLLSVAGGDGGLQDGGGAFNPAILFSEINFLKLLNVFSLSLIFFLFCVHFAIETF